MTSLRFTHAQSSLLCIYVTGDGAVLFDRCLQNCHNFLLSFLSLISASMRRWPYSLPLSRVGTFPPDYHFSIKPVLRNHFTAPSRLPTLLFLARWSLISHSCSFLSCTQQIDASPHYSPVQLICKTVFLRVLGRLLIYWLGDFFRERTGSFPDSGGGPRAPLICVIKMPRRVQQEDFIL